MTYTLPEYTSTLRVDPSNSAGSGGIAGSDISFALPSQTGWGLNDAIIAVIVTNGAITQHAPGWTLLAHAHASSPATSASGYNTNVDKGYDQTDVHVYAYSKDVVDEANDVGALATGWKRTDVGLWAIYMGRLSGGVNKPFCVATAVSQVNTNASYSIAAPVLTATKPTYFLQIGASKVFTLTNDNNIGIPNNALSQPFWFNSRCIWWYEQKDTGVSSGGGTYSMNTSWTSRADNALVAMTLAFVDVKAADALDGVEFYDDLLRDRQKSERMVENVGLLQSSTSLAPFLLVTDIFSTTVALEHSVRSSREALDTATIAEAFELNLGKAIVDAIKLADAIWPNLHFGATITDTTLKLASRLALAYPMSANDTLGFEDAIQCVAAAQVIERLKLAEVLTPTATYGLTLTQAVRLSDTLRRFFGGDTFDTFEVTGDALAKPVIGAIATEGVGIDDTLAPQFVLRVTAEDGVGLVGEWLPQMIYDGHAVEGLEISAGLIEPNGAITTWAINTTNGGVTEYQNYAFNSFAQMGSRYLGASENGLYELNGADDDGAATIARLKTGFMQFGQMHLSSIKGVYLGIRGAGEFFLKIEDGAKKVTTYRALARDFETTRIRTGKGLRARFFRFELASTGQDFDIETIEFIPLIQARRG